MTILGWTLVVVGVVVLVLVLGRLAAALVARFFKNLSRLRP